MIDRIIWFIPGRKAKINAILLSFISIYSMLQIQIRNNHFGISTCESVCGWKGRVLVKRIAQTICKYPHFLTYFVDCWQDIPPVGAPSQGDQFISQMCWIKQNSGVGCWWGTLWGANCWTYADGEMRLMLLQFILLKF